MLAPCSLGLFYYDYAIKFPIYIEIWVFIRFKALLLKPSTFNYAKRPDNILATVLS